MGKGKGECEGEWTPEAPRCLCASSHVQREAELERQCEQRSEQVSALERSIAQRSLSVTLHEVCCFGDHLVVH